MQKKSVWICDELGATGDVPLYIAKVNVIHNNTFLERKIYIIFGNLIIKVSVRALMHKLELASSKNCIFFFFPHQTD